MIKKQYSLLKLIKSNYLLALLLISLWISTPAIAMIYLYIFKTFNSNNSSPLSWQTLGTIGDTFGVVNALFSGIALILVIIATLIQSEEIALQREELKLQREEMRRQVDVLDQQRQEFQSQNILSNISVLENRLQTLLNEKDFIGQNLNDVRMIHGHSTVDDKIYYGFLKKIIDTELKEENKTQEQISDNYLDAVKHAFRDKQYKSILNYSNYLIGILKVSEKITELYTINSMPEVCSSINLRVKESFSKNDIILVNLFMLTDQIELNGFINRFELYITDFEFLKIYKSDYGRPELEKYWDENIVKQLIDSYLAV